MPETVDSHAVVSHEQGGRVLSGVGVSADDLAATMDRHTPPEKQVEATPKPEAASESTPAPAAPLTAAPVGEPKPTRGQARFSELTQQRKAAEERAAAAERRAAELEARLSQPPPAQPAARQEPAAAQPPPAPQYTRPQPSEDEIGAKYETHKAFVADLNRWIFENEHQPSIQALIRQGIEADRASQAFATHAESIRAKGRTIYSDFDAVLSSGPGNQITQQMPPQAIAAVWQHPNAEHLVYAILKDANLAQRLTWLAINQPHAFGFELVKIAPAAPAASSASTGTLGSATPPPPMQPVGSGSRTTVAPSAELARKGGSDYDRSGYREKRAAELGRTRRP